MRAKGSGSVTELGDERFLLRWWESGARRSRVFHGPEADAHATLDDRMRSIAARGDLGGALTVRLAGRAYLDHYELRGGRKGRPGRAAREYRNRFKNHIEEARFIDWPLSELDPPTVCTWSDKLARELGPTSVRHCVYLLSAIYRYAIARGARTTNPVTAVDKPEAGESRRDIVLSEEQIDALGAGEGIPDETMRLVALVLAGTGVRPGELLAVELVDVHADLAAPHMTVRRADRRPSTTTTKSGKKRRVELFGIGLDAVRRWLANVRPRLKVRGHVSQVERWAFPIPAGWLRTDERGRLGAVLRAVGAAGVHAHDLRGTCATHLLSGTWSDEPWTIADVAAHLGDTIQTTERSYAHLVAGRMKHVAARTGNGKRKGNGASVAAADFLAVSAVGHEGLEPSANGLRGPGDPESSPSTSAADYPSVAHLADGYLTRAAEGAPAREHALALARHLASGGAEVFALCATVEAGAPGWDRAANELARRVRTAGRRVMEAAS